MLEEIANFIATKAGLTIGTTLQMGHRTSVAPDRCSVALESAGGSLEPELPDRIDIMIQILTRATTYFTARDDAWAIFDALYTDYEKGSAGWTLPIIMVGKEYEAMIIEPSASPQYVGQDEKRRYEFSTNFIFRIKDKNA